MVPSEIAGLSGTPENPHDPTTAQAWAKCSEQRCSCSELQAQSTKELGASDSDVVDPQRVQELVRRVMQEFATVPGKKHDECETAVRVVGIGGEIISIVACFSLRSIHNVKKQVASVSGIPTLEQDLIHDGRLLAYSETMGSSCLRPGDTLTLVRSKRRLLSCSFDKTVKLWDVNDGLCRSLEFESRIMTSAVDFEGMRAFVGFTDGSLRLLDLHTGLLVQSFIGHIQCVAVVVADWVSLHGMSAGFDCDVLMWDLSNGCRMKTFSGHTKEVLDIDVCWGLERFASVSPDGFLKLWSFEGDCWGSLGEGVAIFCVRVCWESQRAVCGTGKGVLLFDLRGGPVAHLHGHSGCVWSVCANWLDSVALTGAADATLHLWSLTDGSCLMKFIGHYSGSRIWTVTADWTAGFAVSSSDDRTIRVWDLGSSECIRTYEAHNHSFTSLSMQ